MDTYPGGYRLTDASALEIAALFDRLNPRCRNWSIINNCLAVIRRVPVSRAENVAEALLKIARGCCPGASGGHGSDGGTIKPITEIVQPVDNPNAVAS